MASYELNSFKRFSAISLVGAVEQQDQASLNIGFWISDPNQLILWPDKVASNPRRDYLWKIPVMKFSLV